MTKFKTLINHIDSLANLYDTVGIHPFYTHEIAHIFSPLRIHSLVSKRFIEPTGQTTYVQYRTNLRKRKQWKFTSSGIKYIEKHRNDSAKEEII